MKVIIAGSRHIKDYEVLSRTINESGFDISHIISGGADGVDLMAERWSQENEIPRTVFPAQWNKYREMGKVKVAGHIRNSIMAEAGEALILLWDGVSRGSANMLENARKRNLPVYEKIIRLQTDTKMSNSKMKFDSDLFN